MRTSEKSTLLGTWVSKVLVLQPNTGSSSAPQGVRGPSEHGVIVRRALRHGLQDIPVLNHLALFQTEEVCRGGAPVFGRGLDQAMPHNHLGEVLREALYEVDERLEPVWGLWGLCWM